MNTSELAHIQQSGSLHIDEMPISGTSMGDLNIDLFKSYLDKIDQSAETDNLDIKNLLVNVNILKNDQLTLGGLLFFGKNPQRYEPAFCIKAVSFVGNDIGGTEYRDSRNLHGTIPDLFVQAMAFFKTNLRYIQAGQNFNSIGKLEISEIALEEFLQNALVHRDYTKNAPVRAFIFDDRIEIISPGRLPNSLTIENIKYGNSVIRNNLLTTYSSRLMPYRGLGSGVIRALKYEPDTTLINDVEGEQFFVKIPRKS